MTNKLHPKLDQLNQLFKEIQQHKIDHPEDRVAYYTNSVGSILNAYREGDVAFDEAIQALKDVQQTPMTTDNTLRDQMRDAIERDGLICAEEALDRIADICAALVNQRGAVDREKLLNSLTAAAKIAEDFRDTNMRYNDVHKAEILERDREVCQSYIDRINRGDFNASPAPDARVQAVKEAWAVLDEDMDARAVMIQDFYSRWLALKRSIVALPNDSGRDSADTWRLDWLIREEAVMIEHQCNIPTCGAQGKFWLTYPSGKKARGGITIHSQSGEFDTPREAIDAAIAATAQEGK